MKSARQHVRDHQRPQRLKPRLLLGDVAAMRVAPEEVVVVHVVVVRVLLRPAVPRRLVAREQQPVREAKHRQPAAVVVEVAAQQSGVPLFGARILIHKNLRESRRSI
jgi:hypothetical protein